MRKNTEKMGTCHCGKVKFSVISEFKEGLICNCSICSKKGFIHLIVENKDFTLHTSESELTTYTFGTHTAKHLFCRHCGISSFYIPRSHPDGFSVNLRCIDDLDLGQIEIKNFDGRKWEENIHLIK